MTHEMPSQVDSYIHQYSESVFWNKLRALLKRAAKELISKALELYYAAQAPQTPLWAKSAIYGALGYLISLIDVIPDITPLVGYTDDLFVITAALATVAAHITPSIKAEAERKVQAWFGEGGSR